MVRDMLWLFSSGLMNVVVFPEYYSVVSSWVTTSNHFHYTCTFIFTSVQKDGTNSGTEENTAVDKAHVSSQRNLFYLVSMMTMKRCSVAVDASALLHTTSSSVTPAALKTNRRRDPSNRLIKAAVTNRSEEEDGPPLGRNQSTDKSLMGVIKVSVGILCRRRKMLTSSSFIKNSPGWVRIDRTWDCSTPINSAWLGMALVGCAVFITAGINSVWICFSMQTRQLHHVSIAFSLICSLYSQRRKFFGANHVQRD
ncbi:hypothetical protein Pcinc_028638 [Petrolisthes cinctipes]|uniref:Uncharacterized protein n=1 Tax=Petrolisthes cinctipes TaxID=88211 RepID=A0AAE1F2M5_PETCI|nr:hypothetical protein Pcinc_028638 [Petrolisthes cinctipes]